MNLKVNGDALEIADQSTIADLLTVLDLTGKRLAVELNLDIVPKSEHATTTLSEGDRVEIVHAIGGG